MVSARKGSADRARFRVHLDRIKTLTQGQYSDHVVDKMALTFLGLAKFADFNARAPADAPSDDAGVPEPNVNAPEPSAADHSPQIPPAARDAIKLGGFVYNIELHLPESRVPAAYEALFRALKAHLLS